MRVYDCFLFFNELDLLELRLKTLWDVVDQFILVEGLETFSGHPKPLHYAENRERFQKWESKIRAITVPKHTTENAWHREWKARDWMFNGLWDAKNEDIIFQSDCDEIWNPDKGLIGDPDPAVFEQMLCYYHLNTVRVPQHDWLGTRRIRYGHWAGGQELREIKEPRIKDGGWHFSFLGDAAHAALKMKAFSHTEYSEGQWTNLQRIDRAIAAGVDLINPTARYVPIPVDRKFPKPVLEEPERWEKFLLPVSR